MDAPESLFVGAGGRRLHVLAWGKTGTPPLLLLHGSNGHAHLWDDVAQALAGRYRVLALDLRGHGDSERPSPPAYRLADYAADVRAVVAELGLPPVAIAGHSLGSLVTMTVAGTSDLTLAGVALIDIEASPPPYQAQRLNEAGTRPARRFASLDEVTAFEARGLPNVPHERLERIAAHGVRSLPDGTLEHKADRDTLLQFEQADCRSYLAHIHSPALVLRGAESTVMRREVAEEMAATLPCGRFAEIPDAGHQLLIEQPEAVAAALRGWLDQVFAGAEAGR